MSVWRSPMGGLRRSKKKVVRVMECQIEDLRNFSTQHVKEVVEQMKSDVTDDLLERLQVTAFFETATKEMEQKQREFEELLSSAVDRRVSDIQVELQG